MCPESIKALISGVRYGAGSIEADIQVFNATTEAAYTSLPGLFIHCFRIDNKSPRDVGVEARSLHVVTNILGRRLWNKRVLLLPNGRSDPHAFRRISRSSESTGGASVRPLRLVETRTGCEGGCLCRTPVRSGPSGVASEINVPVSLGREVISRCSIETASCARTLSGARRCKNGTHCASNCFAALLRRNGQSRLSVYGCEYSWFSQRSNARPPVISVVCMRQLGICCFLLLSASYVFVSAVTVP